MPGTDPTDRTHGRLWAMTTVGLVGTGHMGSALGHVLSRGGHEVVTTLAGRSPRSARLAGAAGLAGTGPLPLALLHLLRGEAKLTLGGDTIEGRAGTWVHMPANLKHAIEAITPVVMLLVLLK